MKKQNLFIIVLEDEKSQSMVSVSGESLLTGGLSAEFWWGAEHRVTRGQRGIAQGLLFSSQKALIAQGLFFSSQKALNAPPSWPHLILVTSQRCHLSNTIVGFTALLILFQWRLSFNMSFRDNKHSNHSIVHLFYSPPSSSFLYSTLPVKRFYLATLPQPIRLPIKIPVLQWSFRFIVLL